jgi:hypothetical protein
VTIMDLAGIQVSLDFYYTKIFGIQVFWLYLHITQKQKRCTV